MRVFLFAVAVVLGLLGFGLAVDSLIPKERPASALGEGLAGLAILALAGWIGAKSRQRPG